MVWSLFITGLLKDRLDRSELSPTRGEGCGLQLAPRAKSDQTADISPRGGAETRCRWSRCYNEAASTSPGNPVGGDARVLRVVEVRHCWKWSWGMTSFGEQML